MEDNMEIIKALNYKFSEEIEMEIIKNHEYITADKKVRKFIREVFSDEKAERLDDLLGIITSIVSDTYLEEGIRLGARATLASVF